MTNPKTQTCKQIASADNVVPKGIDFQGSLCLFGPEHPGILIIGLVFAVGLMGVAANVIAKYIERYRWIAWVGLAVIVYVAFKMIWEGSHEVAPIAQAFAMSV